MARIVPISTVRSITAVLIVLPTVNSTMEAISTKMKPKMALNIWMVCTKNGFRVRKSSTVSGCPGATASSRAARRAFALSSCEVRSSCTMIDVAFGAARP